MRDELNRDEWSPARLIPVVGIRGQDEQEGRATSALLAVMAAVPEFGHALLHDLGAPRGKLLTFTEVQLRDEEGKVSIPDGVAIAQRGQKMWRALFEVKTGSAALQTEQVSRSRLPANGDRALALTGCCASCETCPRMSA